MNESPAVPRSPLFQLGRPFMHPILDYLLVGGGLSIIVVCLASVASDGLAADAWLTYLPFLFLLSNSSHFAASTVRLYSKQDSFRALPFLTMLFPLVALGMATLAIVFPDELGRHLIALYLTWSPFHYSAQSYGLAVMYCYRSGCQLSDGQKRLLRWCCMITFIKVALTSPHIGIGIWWILPWSSVSEYPLAQQLLAGTIRGLGLLAFTLPVVLYVSVLRKGSRPVPLISMLIVFTNALWFFAFRYINGWAWATVFHGVQYLAIVTVFHVKDRIRLPNNRHGPVYHAVWFYSVCLLLAYMIFRCLPSAYMVLGFGYVESSIMVVGVINLHHFIVDGYIWRLRKDSNYSTVTDGESAS